MKLLLIGDAFSQYTIAFSYFLKQYDPTVTIDIINIRLVNSDIVYSEGFLNSYDKVYKNGFINKFLSRIPKVRGLINRINQERIIKDVNKLISTYDVICLQGFWESSLNIYDKLHTENIFTVGAIWGSDFYRRQNEDSMLFATFDKCNRILVSSDEMINDIRSVYNLSDGKARKCIFGLEPLETLIRMEQVSSSESKEEMGIDKNAFVITCGYNGSSSQEHFKIIEQLAKIKKVLPPSYILLFPVTYGGTKDYVLSIKEKLKKLELNCLVIENYLTDEEISFLRIATDIFIQVQKTDAFSGSMREHLFAKNIVLTGKWLPYQSLVNDGIYFETINNLEELGRSIANIIKNYHEYKQKVNLQNTPDKFERFRWPISIKEWHKTFLEYKSIKHD